MGAEWASGFYCPWHGSKYDLSGWVLKSSTAPLNLPVPPNYFANDSVLRIGARKHGAGYFLIKSPIVASVWNSGFS